MNEKNNIHTLLTAILLIVAGLISPSNGVDDKSNKTPIEMIMTIFIILTVSITVYVIWILVENRKESAKRSVQREKERS